MVSNTSPISYLLLVDCLFLLPKLFGEIHIPQAVFDELNSVAAPGVVRAWIAELPEWLKVHARTSGEEDVTLSKLHVGERDAITLAEQLQADLILLDEKAARRVASERGLKMMGLLGLVVEAAERDLIDLPEIVGRLQHTTFRASPRLLKSVLDRHCGRS